MTRGDGWWHPLVSSSEIATCRELFVTQYHPLNRVDNVKSRIQLAVGQNTVELVDQPDHYYRQVSSLAGMELMLLGV